MLSLLAGILDRRREGRPRRLPARRRPVHMRQLLPAAAGVGLGMLLFPGLPGPARLAGLLGVLGAAAWERRRQQLQRRSRPAEARRFLVDLRLHTALEGSLLLGLERQSRAGMEATPLGEALRECLAGGLPASGTALLAQLAERADCPPLAQAARRAHAAALGGGPEQVDRALALEVDRLDEEIGRQAEEELQQMPARLSLLAMPFLLGPIVILLFYPLVDRILATLSGVPGAGGL